MLHMWLQTGLTLLVTFVLSIVIGKYLAKVVTEQKTWLDPIFNPVDNLIYRLVGKRVTQQAMNWKTYAVHMLVTNLIMAILIYLILVFHE